MSIKRVINGSALTIAVDIALLGLFTMNFIDGVHRFGWETVYYALLGMLVMLMIVFISIRYARESLRAEYETAYEDAVDSASLDRECDCPPVPMEKVFAELDMMDSDPSGKHSN